MIVLSDNGFMVKNSRAGTLGAGLLEERKSPLAGACIIPEQMRAGFPGITVDERASADAPPDFTFITVSSYEENFA